MRFSLRTLFIVVTLSAVASFIGYLATRPFNVIKRIDCGSGRWIELLSPNEFCDQGGPVHYRYAGMPAGKSPPYFCIWSCGYEETHGLTLVAAESGNLVAVVSGNLENEVFLLVDFAARESWPTTDGREVDEPCRDMVCRLRKEHGDLWLWSTDDGELTKPRP